MTRIIRTPAFLRMLKTKAQISCTETTQLTRAFVLTTTIVQSLYFLNPKVQASSHLLWPHIPVCVGNPKDRFLMTRLKYNHSLEHKYRMSFNKVMSWLQNGFFPIALLHITPLEHGFTFFFLYGHKRYCFSEVEVY